jgi:cytochrome c nitrite reductase small subunit
VTRRVLSIALVVLGLAALALVRAGGAAYWTDAPEACASCHVMRPQYDAWRIGVHRASAVCNDCHTPSGLAEKWLTKSTSGLAHAWSFTTGRYPSEIHIRAGSLALVQRACAECHAANAEAADHGGRRRDDRPCAQCHAGVGHS